MGRWHSRKPQKVPPEAQAAARARFNTARAKLQAASGLGDNPADAARLDCASWLLLAQENTQTLIMLGRAVPLSEMKAYADMIADIMPKNKTLNIRFIDHSDRCVVCGGPLPALDQRQQAAPVADASATDPQATPAALQSATTVGGNNVVELPAKPPRDLHAAVAAANTVSQPFSLPAGCDSRSRFNRFDNRNE